MTKCHYIRLYVILPFFALFSLPVFAQQAACECAEETRLRPEIVRFFNTGKVDSAVLIFEQLRRTGTPECRIVYCDAMAQYYFNKNETAPVEALMEEERRLLDSMGCGNKAVARHLITYGNYFSSINQYEKAAEKFLAALSRTEGTDNLFGQQRALINLTVVFANLQQYDKVVAYLKRAEVLATQMKNTNELGMIQVRMASAYNNLYEAKKTPAYLDSALVAGRRGVLLTKETQNLPAMCDGFVALAAQARYAQQYAQGILYADSVLLFLPKVLAEKYRYQAFQSKSQLYMALHDNRTAAMFADSALAAAEKFNPQMTASALQQVYETQKLLGNPTRALAAFERYSVLRDSLANIDKFNKINELEQQYEKVKNEKSIRELTQDKQIFLLRNRLLLLGVLLAALIIAVLVFLQRQRALKNKQTTLETEQRLNRARMNPHFFFNALGALQGLALKAPESRQVVQHLSKFAAIMRQTLESTYTDYIPIAQEKEYLEQYLDLQKLRFPDAFEYEIEVASDLEEEQVLVPPMLLQPFAENAIEHGFTRADAQNLLLIRFSKTADGNLLLEIDDNGKGLNTSAERSKKHTSRATQIVADRLQLINQQHKGNAHFELENKPEGGVLARIYLPLVERT